jgi:CheY-like chemotaxis protein
MTHDLSEWIILIVDDEPDNLGVMELVLRFHKAEVHIANSGDLGLQMLDTIRPTVALVDIQMPGISGYEFLRLAREQAAWQHLPMIAVTAHAMEGDETVILQAGFDGYISKPIEAMKLAGTLVSMVGARVTT